MSNLTLITYTRRHKAKEREGGMVTFQLPLLSKETRRIKNRPGKNWPNCNLRVSSLSRSLPQANSDSPSWAHPGTWRKPESQVPRANIWNDVCFNEVGRLEEIFLLQEVSKK